MNHFRRWMSTLLVAVFGITLIAPGCDSKQSSRSSSPPQEMRDVSQPNALPQRSAMPNWTPIPAQRTPVDPVEAFKLKAAWFNNKNVLCRVNDKLAYVKISSVKYDVRKTDSMVIPVIGIVQITAETRAYNYTYTLNYAFQDEAWTYRTTNLTIADRQFGASTTKQIDWFNPDTDCVESTRQQ